jgi:hypothetical protein
MNDDVRRGFGDGRPTDEDARLERILANGLVASAPSRAPARLLPQIEQTLSQLGPRPRWLAILKEPPMRYRSHVAVGSPTARVAALAAVTMLVAVVGAGALVAGAQTPSPAPSEVPTAMAGVWVTGTMGPTPGQRTSGTRMVEGVEYEFYHDTDFTIEMSDPRLTGSLSQAYLQIQHPVAGQRPIRVYTGEYRIENEGGSWEGTLAGMQGRAPGPGWTITDTGLLVGSGAYEGLTAYLEFEFGLPSEPVPVTGAIFPGGLPPMITFEDLSEE